MKWLLRGGRVARASGDGKVGGLYEGVGEVGS
jgi:hypothetical protein